MKKLLMMLCFISAGCAGMNGERQGQVDGQNNSTLPAGEAVFKSRGCSGCHSISGVGGNLGPDLTNIGAKRSKEWLAEQIKEPKSKNPASIMPAYKNLSKTDLNALVDYLASLK